MKGELLNELLHHVISEYYRVSDNTQNIINSIPEDDKNLKNAVLNAYDEGFIDGFKYAMKLSQEIFSNE